ncbi:MAG: hypothetical protein KJ600_02970 [Nanoarchaeota archaeon]|nr:hypothetical protein [Nanoarchaeota archaeon]MBU1103491.1 hypothetical protein [Nanoarchaeota archaeon]
MTLESVTAFYSNFPLWLILIISTWSLVWKALALWKAAAIKKNAIWFIVLLVVNTLGILEILYLFIFSEMGKGKKKKR